MMPALRPHRRDLLSTAIVAALILSLITSISLPTLKHRNNPLTYALTKDGFVGLPAVAPLPTPTPTAATSINKSEIVTVYNQSPPPIPKPITYPKKPGTILILSKSSLTPHYLSSLRLKFRYVIVTSSTLVGSVIPLATIHAAEGLNVLIATMRWIKNNFPAKKPCDSLRHFARFAHYELGAVYLLLAGDVNVVPTAYWYSEDLFLDDGEDAYKATDQYYAFLDGNWDPNGNGKLLETLDTNGDDIPDENLEPLPDSVPDLYVGRLPASTPSQMKALVNDIVSYLTNPPPGNWVRKAILIAAIANFQNESGSNVPEVDLAHVAQYVYGLLLPHNYKVIRVYQDEGLETTAYPHEVSLTHSNVIKLLSEGSDLLYSAAHGIPLAQGMKVWLNDTNGNGIPDKNEIVFRYFLQVWDPIDNHGKRFLAYLESCLTGYYDFNQDSLAEYLLRHSAIAVIASSRVSYYQVPWPGPGGWLDQELSYLFWKELTGKAEWKPGPALELSKYDYIKEHGGNASAMKFMSKKDLLNYNLLGDPAITIWVSKPSKLNITYGRLEASRVNKFMIKDDEGKPVDRALVAIYSAATGDLLAYGYTNSSGIALLNIPSVQRSAKVYVVARKDGYTYALRTAYVAYIGAPPIVNLSLPSNRTVYGALVPVFAHAVDLDGNVTEVKVKISGPGANLTKLFTPHKPEFTVNFTFRANESGAYVITVSAVDNDGNQVSVKKLFMVDVTPPEIMVTGVSNTSATNKAGGTVRVVVSDSSGVRFVEILLDGRIVTRKWNVSKSVTLDVKIPSRQGPHALIVTAADKVRNVAREVILFYVDLTPPSISVYPNVNGSVINQRKVRNLIITCNDNYRVAYVTVYVDGKLSLNVSRYKLKQVNLSRLSDGRHNVTVLAFDTAGNGKRVSLLFYADSKPPTVRMVGVEPRTYVNKSSLTLEVTAHDNIGLRYLEVFLNGKTVLKKTFAEGNITPYLKAPHRTTNVDLKLTLGLSNGHYVLEVIAGDLAGNNAYKNTTFYVDTAPPKVKIVMPKNGSYVNTTDVVINVNTADNLCLASVTAYVNDSPVKLVDGAGKYKAPGNGKYVLNVYARDCAGNKASANGVFHVDLTPPTVTFIKPGRGAVTKTPFQLSVNARDNYGVRLIYVIVDGKVIRKLRLARPVSEYRFNTVVANLPEGPHHIVVMVKDVAGNVGRGNLTLTIDNTPPSIYCVNRTEAFTTGNLRLVFKVNESSHVKAFKALVDGHVVNTVRVGNNEWVVELRNLSVGKHELILYAEDQAGNTGVMKITIVIKHTYMLEVMAFTIGSVVVVAGLIMLYVKRRKERGGY